jgi:hypothetical protein
MRHWCTTLMLAVAAAASASAHANGYVLSLQGRWALQGAGAPLGVGAPVPAGSRLVAAAPAADDHITIIEAHSGAVLLSHRCRTAAQCSQPIALPRSNAPTGGDGLGLVAAIASRLAGQPDRYVTTLSRGPAALPDTVLPMGSDGVDLAPALQGLRPGTYTLRLAPLRCNGGPPCDAVATLEMRDWQPSQAARIAAQPVAVYELDVSPPPGSGLPPRPNSWVLLVPQNKHARAMTFVGAAQSLADSWGTQVDPPTKRAFVRATFDTLLD